MRLGQLGTGILIGWTLISRYDKVVLAVVTSLLIFWCRSCGMTWLESQKVFAVSIARGTAQNHVSRHYFLLHILIANLSCFVGHNDLLLHPPNRHLCPNICLLCRYELCLHDVCTCLGLWTLSQGYKDKLCLLQVRKQFAHKNSLHGGLRQFAGYVKLNVKVGICFSVSCFLERKSSFDIKSYLRQ